MQYTYNECEIEDAIWKDSGKIQYAMKSQLFMKMAVKWFCR